jgi:hypothetical protein
MTTAHSNRCMTKARSNRSIARPVITMVSVDQAEPDDYSDITVARTDAESAPLEGKNQYSGFQPESGCYQGYATTFADQRDLAAYHAAINSGATEEQALKVGDNGIGNEDLGKVRTSQSYGRAIPRAAGALTR